MHKNTETYNVWLDKTLKKNEGEKKLKIYKNTYIFIPFIYFHVTIRKKYIYNNNNDSILNILSSYKWNAYIYAKIVFIIIN